jgi:hypothetical protein
MIKCRRTICRNEIDDEVGGGIHRHTFERYCLACTRLINRENGQELIVIPKFRTGAPNLQQIPKDREPK